MSEVITVTALTNKQLDVTFSVIEQILTQLEAAPAQGGMMCNPAPSRSDALTSSESTLEEQLPQVRLALMSGRLRALSYGPTEDGSEAVQRWISARPLMDAADILVRAAEDGLQDTGGLATSGSLERATAGRQATYALEEAERLMARIEAILAV